MNPETHQPESLENKNLSSKILGILKSTGQSIIKVLDTPFEWYSRNQVGGLLELDPNPKESGMIEDSVTQKYIPATRNAVLATAMGVPGILMADDPTTIQIILTAIFTTTGVAWFTMSLKEVKEKFSPFGINLTSCMLQAFLSTLLMTTVSAGFTIMSPEVQAILRWATEANVDLTLPKTGLDIAARTGTVLSGSFIIKKLISAVIKFDANDAMLTGSADVAKKFFEKSISTLREAAKILKSEHVLEAANQQIANALNDYYEFLLEIKAPIPTELDPDKLKEITLNPCMDQKAFDQIMLPMLKGCISQFERFISRSKPAETHKFETAMGIIKNLKKQYETDGIIPKQALADTMIATSFDNLASFMEMFKDNLVALNTQRFATQATA
jgi:hypothetical protein